MNLFGKTKVQESIDTLFKQDFSGQIYILQNDSLVLNYCSGFSDRNWNTKINDSSLFEIGHVSQTFISKFLSSLNDGISNYSNRNFVDYFPDFPYPDITINHLWTHQSGLPNNYIKLYHRFVFQDLNIKLKDKSKRISNEDILTVLEKSKPPLTFKPGTKFEFNSLNFLLLASLIEKISGQTINEFAKENNFGHAILIEEKTDSIIGKANAYQFINNSISPFDNLNHLGLEYTDGTLGNQHFYSSAKNLAKWGGDELKSTFDSIVTIVPESDFFKGYFYNKTHQAYISRGEFGGNSCYLIIQPKKKLIIAITSNERGKVNFKQSIDDLLRILSVLLP